MISRRNLNKRICDCEKRSKCKQTYKEFLREMEKELGIDELPIEDFSDEELEIYLETIDLLQELGRSMKNESV